MESFSCSTRVLSGDAGEILSSLEPKRLLMVADPFFEQNGTAKALCPPGTEVRYFSGVQPDPTVELAARGTRAVQEFQPDVIVALGGGSAMDCAKAMKFFARSDACLVAVPTTSGSGSEVTDFAILTHDGVKHPLVDERLRPQVAVLDASLVAGLPRALVADGGFDALTHALEAYTATRGGAVTGALAAQAFATVYRELPLSFAGKSGARMPVHEGATMAGLAFTQAGLGLCHALAHALGGQFHLPHGRLNAILLPAVMEVNAPGCGRRYAELAGRVGLEGRGEVMGVRNLRGALCRLRKSLGLPSTLSEAGVSPGELRRCQDKLVRAALEDPCCRTNPVPVREELVLRVLEQATGHG